MSTIRRRGKSWEAQVFRQGVRKSSSFKTKAEALAWSHRMDLEIIDGVLGQIPDYPFSKLLERYRDEVTMHKRGAREEGLRIAAMLRDELASVRLPVLSSTHFASWRDRRLKKVSSASVLREWTILNSVIDIALKEWGWLRENPLREVRRPKAAPPRDRRITEEELEKLKMCFGYQPDTLVTTVTGRVGVAFLFAIETAMRAGEIASLLWEDIRGDVAKLRMTKNGFPRSVALSPEAQRLLKQLPDEGALAFNLQTRQIDALFRKVRDGALISDLHFHDSRHEAITRLACKLNVLDLARMVGIRDLRILMVYYNATPQDIAARLR